MAPCPLFQMVRQPMPQAGKLLNSRCGENERQGGRNRAIRECFNCFNSRCGENRKVKEKLDSLKCFNCFNSRCGENVAVIVTTDGRWLFQLLQQQMR